MAQPVAFSECRPVTKSEIKYFHNNCDDTILLELAKFNSLTTDSYVNTFKTVESIMIFTNFYIVLVQLIIFYRAHTSKLENNND